MTIARLMSSAQAWRLTLTHPGSGLGPWYLEGSNEGLVGVDTGSGDVEGRQSRGIGSCSLG